MRFLTLALALIVIASAPAHATENRMHVSDINHFVNEANQALNNPNPNIGRAFLDKFTSASAIFENRVSLAQPYAHNPYYNPHWNQVWYNNQAYNPYYRYPLNPYYSPTSVKSLRKWDHINMFTDKKQRIPGYRTELKITDTTISPYGSTAVVDLDLREYSLSYAPYNPNLSQRVMHSSGKCKMYLSKVSEIQLLITRLDCNTNSSLPY